jgi:protein O-mannosyl-transferase
MAKKVNKTTVKTKSENGAAAVVGNDHLIVDRPITGLYSFRIQALIVALLAFICYANTYNNTYALDDTAIIVQNEYVHQGFDGIGDILTKDVYYSYFKQLNTTNQLSGGRYRPLSVVSFAVEQQFFGPVHKGQTDSIISYGLNYGQEAQYEKKFVQQMHIRHIFNVVWYVLAILALLYFFRNVVFRGNTIMALLATVLFTVHPIHTEVVANVKSRDEIMSVLFICLTFIFAFKYLENRKIWAFVLALVSYFLAFLSKEYAITLIVLLPLSFFLFNRFSLGKSLLATLPYLAVAVIYIFIRLQVIGQRNELSDNDIQINPYALASGTEKLATEISTSLNYLKLLVFPHPLSSDYSYNQIPYRDFGSPLVWLSILVHLSLFAGFIYFLRKRSVLSFGIAFYLLNLLMVNNLVFDIGATMGERLIFHSSIGFAIVVVYLMYKGMERIKPATKGRLSLAGLILVIIVLCGFKTITRNRDWQSDETLFFKDIRASPNSFLVNANVGCMLINKSDFEKDEKVRIESLERGVRLFTKVLGMQDNYVLAYMNRGVAYYKLGMADSLVADLDKVRSIYPIHPQLPEMYYRAGMLYFDKNQYARSYDALQQSFKLNPKNTEVLKAINKVGQLMADPK